MQHIISDLNTQLASKNAQLAALTARLAEIEGSRAWKLVRLLWRIRTYLALSGSLQVRIFKKVLHKARTITSDSMAATPSPAETKAVSEVFLSSPGDPARPAIIPSLEP